MRIEQLKKVDHSMTIGEYLKDLEQKEILRKEKGEATDKFIIEKYKGTVIELVDEDGLFGKTYNYLEITSVLFETLDENCERLYSIKGKKLTVSEGYFRERSLDEWCTFGKLAKGRKVSKEEFEQINLKKKEVYKIINSVIGL